MVQGHIVSWSGVATGFELRCAAKVLNIRQGLQAEKEFGNRSEAYRALFHITSSLGQGRLYGISPCHDSTAPTSVPCSLGWAIYDVGRYEDG